MKTIVFILLVLHSLNLFSQSVGSDMALIANHAEIVPLKKYRKYTSLNKAENKLQQHNPINLVFSGLMYFYQNVLSSQINAGCLYTPSCSEFGKCSIKQHGLLVGMFLTADRLNRCNRVTAIELTSNNPRHKGKIADDCSKYSFKD
ncbi:MAG: membrane protein insertion efficiency factor YidD [Bacteroidia bacterium]